MTLEASRTDLLIVAAHAPEMAGLRPWLSDKLIGQIRGLTVRGKAVGIGMASAGPATARGILAVSPRAVLLVGSCGVTTTFVKETAEARVADEKRRHPFTLHTR